MVREPRVHFAGALYHVLSRGNQNKSIFKELVKDLHQDPAVLSRGSGKLPEELSSKPELSCVVETLYDNLRKRRRPQRIEEVCPTTKSFRHR